MPDGPFTIPREARGDGEESGDDVNEDTYKNTIIIISQLNTKNDHSD